MANLSSLLYQQVANFCFPILPAVLLFSPFRPTSFLPVVCYGLSLVVPCFESRHITAVTANVTQFSHTHVSPCSNNGNSVTAWAQSSHSPEPQSHLFVLLGLLHLQPLNLRLRGGGYKTTARASAGRAKGRPNPPDKHEQKCQRRKTPTANFRRLRRCSVPLEHFRGTFCVTSTVFSSAIHHCEALRKPCMRGVLPTSPGRPCRDTPFFASARGRACQGTVARPSPHTYQCHRSMDG